MQFNMALSESFCFIKPRQSFRNQRKRCRDKLAYGVCLQQSQETLSQGRRESVQNLKISKYQTRVNDVGGNYHNNVFSSLYTLIICLWFKSRAPTFAWKFSLMLLTKAVLIVGKNARRAYLSSAQVNFLPYWLHRTQLTQHISKMWKHHDITSLSRPFKQYLLMA